MKFISCLVVLFTVVAASKGFAAGVDESACAGKAKEAAQKVYANGNSRVLNYLNGGAELVEKDGDSLIYKVSVFEEYSDDDSSTDFPGTDYKVKARGTVNQCEIISVEKN
jgi:hypothetical protein